MTVDVGQVASATVNILAPFTPFLIEAGKAGGKKLAEVIAEKGGEEAWTKAQALWGKIKARFDNDSEVQSAVTMVAAKPEDEMRQTILAEVLGARLQEDPALTREIFDLLGGQKAMLKVIADRSSWVENVTQLIEGKGSGKYELVTQASDDSVIVGVNQKITTGD